MINATVSGFLGAEPETRQAGSSTVTELRIASTDGFGDKKSTTWIRASVWGQSGEKAAQYLHKGDGVICSGRVVLREYETRDGAKGSSLELQDARWDFPPVRKSDSGGGRRDEPKASTYDESEVPF